MPVPVTPSPRVARRAAGPERPKTYTEFTTTITDLDHEGRGVGRQPSGKVVFVVDGLPGEEAVVRITSAGKSADEARVLELLTASPDRAVPPCPHFGVCGGCALQHLAPDAQVRAKEAWLLDALERLGGARPAAWAAPLRGPTEGYRRKARLGVKRVQSKHENLVGFRERNTHFLARLTTCETLDPRVGHHLPAIAAAIGETGISHRIPQIECAVGDAGVTLAVRVLDPPTEADRAALRGLAERLGYDIWLQPGGVDTRVPLVPGTERQLFFTPDGRHRLAFEVTDFIQVNDPVNRAMVAQALAWLAPRPGERVLELFCGLGNFTLPLAATGARVVAVEGDAGLVARGRANLLANGLDAEYHAADLFKPDASAPWLQGPIDAVLIDPPRAGAAEVLPLVAAQRPGRLVYVSCHPATLARDAAILAGHGYALARAGVMDMFPHTAHVESMALFTPRLD